MAIKYCFLFLLLYSCTQGSSDVAPSKKVDSKETLEAFIEPVVDTIDYAEIAAMFNPAEDLLYQYCFVISKRDQENIGDLRTKLRGFGFDVKMNKVFEQGIDNYKPTYFYAEVRGVPTPKDAYYNYSMYDDNEARISDAYQVINIDFPNGLKQLQKEVGKTTKMFRRHNVEADTTVVNPTFPNPSASYFNSENSRLLYFFSG